MQARELRIGNWYTSVKFGVPIKWELTDFSQLDVMSDGAYNDPPIDEMIEPIPLTEEWLLKFGFFNIMEDEIMIFEKDKFALNANAKSHYTCTYKGNFMRFILYVHQLQNLYFALTGEELTIKDNG